MYVCMYGLIDWLFLVLNSLWYTCHPVTVLSLYAGRSEPPQSEWVATQACVVFGVLSSGQGHHSRDMPAAPAHRAYFMAELWMGFGSKFSVNLLGFTLRCVEIFRSKLLLIFLQLLFLFADPFLSIVCYVSQTISIFFPNI